jgi:hypothetical protein
VKKIRTINVLDSKGLEISASGSIHAMRLYQTLPVASKCNHDAVVMDYPEDTVARDGMAKALSPSTRFVGADHQVIQSIIEQLWPQTVNPSIHILGVSNFFEIYCYFIPIEIEGSHKISLAI